jgi:DNA processing protein
MAVEQNRDVYAIPGDPGDVGAQGPNRLIQEGAKLIRGAQDVLDEMQLSRQLILPLPELDSAKSHVGVSDVSRKLLEHLSEPLHVDDLVARTGIAVSCVSSSLLQLELAGLVEKLDVGVFQRVG